MGVAVKAHPAGIAGRLRNEKHKGSGCWSIETHLLPYIRYFPLGTLFVDAVFAVAAQTFKCDDCADFHHLSLNLTIPRICYLSSYIFCCRQCRIAKITLSIVTRSSDLDDQIGVEGGILKLTRI